MRDNKQILKLKYKLYGSQDMSDYYDPFFESRFLTKEENMRLTNEECQILHDIRTEGLESEI